MLQVTHSLLRVVYLVFTRGTKLQSAPHGFPLGHGSAEGKRGVKSLQIHASSQKKPVVHGFTRHY